MSKLTKQNFERLEREIEVNGEMIEDLKTIAGFDRVKKDQLILLFINLLHEAGGNLPRGGHSPCLPEQRFGFLGVKK